MLFCVLLVGCFTSQQHASVSQGRICTDNFTCCHIETEVADQTFYLTQSQYTDTGPTSPSADPIVPGAWQGSHCSADFKVIRMTRHGKIPSQSGFKPRIFRSRGGRLNHYASEAVLLNMLKFIFTIMTNCCPLPDKQQRSRRSRRGQVDLLLHVCWE